MLIRRRAVIALLLGLLMSLPTLAAAGLIFAPFSTCTAVVTQNPSRLSCINSFNPDVVRLCPSTASPIFDSVTYTVTLLDALGARVTGTTVSVYETSGTLNIATGGATTAVSDSIGKATVILRTGSGCGQASICAGGVYLCSVSVRSPDVAYGALAGGCPLPTSGTSVVNINDLTNPACGFLSKFGAVTPGVNDCWDLDCTGVVNSTDIVGGVSKGMFLPHVLHGGALATTTTCP